MNICSKFLKKNTSISCMGSSRGLHGVNACAVLEGINSQFVLWGWNLNRSHAALEELECYNGQRKNVSGQNKGLNQRPLGQ